MNARTELLYAIDAFEAALGAAKLVITSRIDPRDGHVAIVSRQPSLERLTAQVIDNTATLLAALIEAGASGNVAVDLTAGIEAMQDAVSDARHDAWERTRESASEPYLAAAE